MNRKTIRAQLDAYTKERYGVEPEILPFSRENYEIYRHPSTGKWFAVFIVKDRDAFGLGGEGLAEVLSLKLKDPLFADFLMQQPGFLRGYPSKSWNWVSVVLDGTVPFENICRWLDESYEATRAKRKNMQTLLIKKEVSKTADSSLIYDLLFSFQKTLKGELRKMKTAE